jgi:hypothetical protein
VTFKISLVDVAEARAAGRWPGTGECYARGFDDAKGRFGPRKQYTLQEVVNAGLSDENLLALIAAEAARNGDAMRRFRGWAESVGAVGDLRTPRAVLLGAAEARKRRAREVMAAEGVPRPEARARIWAADFAALLAAFETVRHPPRAKG